MIDLIPFKLGEVDIIIRMGWLTPNGAQTDCKGERVINKGWRQIQRFLNIVQTKKLLRQRYEA